MNKLYNNSIKKGARIRVLATGELGTVAEKQLIRKGGETKIYCRVKLDKKPEQDTWYFSDQLGDTKESAFITFCDNTDKKIIVGVEIDHEKDCVSNLKVAGMPDKPEKHQGLYRYLATTFIQVFKDSRPCTSHQQ